MSYDTFTTVMREISEYALEDTVTKEEAYVIGALDARHYLSEQEVTDAEITSAMVAFQGHPDLVSAWRAALSAARKFIR